MKRRYGLAIAWAVAFLCTQPSIARADDSLETDPQPYRCEDSVVTRLGTYFEQDPTSGYYVTFQSRLGVERFADAQAAVVDRNARAESAISRQRVGDKVQVCLIHTPTREPGCDPTQDSRGRIYRVYNYRLRAAYSGWNSNHYCGGA